MKSQTTGFLYLMLGAESACVPVRELTEDALVSLLGAHSLDEVYEVALPTPGLFKAYALRESATDGAPNVLAHFFFGTDTVRGPMVVVRTGDVLMDHEAAGLMHQACRMYLYNFA